MSRTPTDLVTLSGPAMGSRWTARLADPPPGLGAALAAAGYTVIFPNPEAVIALHGHAGATTLHWID